MEMTIAEAAASAALARLADAAITAALAGMERTIVVDHVRAMEDKGATPDQITDSLQSMAKESADKARAAIAAAPE
jgi:hypothetical protein